VWLAFPDAAEVLGALKSRGLVLGVVSNWEDTPGSSLEGILEAVGLMRYLDFALPSHAVGAAKPNPRIFQAALQRAGVSAWEAVHVGDSLTTDVAGARGAGITPILIDRRGRRASPGCAVIRDLRELPKLVELEG